LNVYDANFGYRSIQPEGDQVWRNGSNLSRHNWVFDKDYYATDRKLSEVGVALARLPPRSNERHPHRERASRVSSETFGLECVVYALNLLQAYFASRVHSLHPFSQESLVDKITLLSAVLKVSSSKELLFVRHSINARLDFRGAHNSTINCFTRMASCMLAFGPFRIFTG